MAIKSVSGLTLGAADLDLALSELNALTSAAHSDKAHNAALCPHCSFLFSLDKETQRRFIALVCDVLRDVEPSYDILSFFKRLGIEDERTVVLSEMVAAKAKTLMILVMLGIRVGRNQVLAEQSNELV